MKIMKLSPLLLVSFFFGLSVSADTNVNIKNFDPVACFTEDSITVKTTPRNCSNDCAGHEERQPNEIITLDMADNLKKKQAFFKNPKLSCSGSGCYSAKLGSASIEGGQKAIGSFRVWGEETVIMLSADVCTLR
jgi:hypothetical protein